MNQADYQCIAFERRGRVLVLHLDRPDQLNAVDARLHAELSRVFTDAELDAGSDVVVLTGKGKAFCAGGDLDWMQSAIDRPAEFEQTAVEARAIRMVRLARCSGPSPSAGTVSSVARARAISPRSSSASAASSTKS